MLFGNDINVIGDMTLVSHGNFMSGKEKKSEVLKKMGNNCGISDYAILLGAAIPRNYDPTDQHPAYWLASGKWSVDCTNNPGITNGKSRNGGIRPAINLKNLKGIDKHAVVNSEGIKEIQYGEYPQTVASKTASAQLNMALADGSLKKTGRKFTYDAPSSNGVTPTGLEEYELDGKKYVRVPVNYQSVIIEGAHNGRYDAFCTSPNSRAARMSGVKPASYTNPILSNGAQYEPGIGEYVWIEVEPITWYVDEENQMLICKDCLASGVPENIHGGSCVEEFVGKYMTVEIGNTVFDMNKQNKKGNNEVIIDENQQYNPYGFDFSDVTEEEIIEGSIEAGIPAFLHGPSSEGKSARVKEIDSDLTIIYLRNATPESLNGKSVYNSETKEMIDIKPTWLVKLEEKCEREPNKIHIVFFDEISNALPSIQGIAFNIVLDKEVNGLWQLPENARIVAAGNEMKDSLSANQIAEPLFNRFAHVFIKTTTEGWLEWASQNNIHPLIYAYIAYTKGESLRTEYDGVTPNADPRKWEMASKMLYATGNPEMLRALVGEDVTKNLIKFCRQKAITLYDVLTGNYNSGDLRNLSREQKYVTVLGLTQVDEANLETARNFAKSLGDDSEYVDLFDAIWIHGDERRFDMIAEFKMREAYGM